MGNIAETDIGMKSIAGYGYIIGEERFTGDVLVRAFMMQRLTCNTAYTSVRIA
jgi:hypothetical protein